MIIRIQSIKAKNRRGIAILEFGMCLPLVLLAFLFIVFGARLFLTRVYVAQQPRQATYPQRHGQPSAATMDLNTSSNIGKIFRQPANGGLISDKKTKDVPIPSRLGQGIASLAEQDHVLGGSWDYQTFPYQTRAPLQVNPIFGVYDSRAARNVATVSRVLSRVGR